MLAAVLILNTINPHLTELNIFANAPSLQNIRGGIGDTRSHAEIDEDERAANPVIKSTFTGTFGSKEHVTYVRKCLDEGGRVVLSATNNRTVECRTKE